MRPSLRQRLLRTSPLVAAVVLMADPAGAATVDITDPQVAIDNIFVIICAALVVFMQAGFAMVEAGMTRAKNAAHMMMKNLMDFSIGLLMFGVVGYHIAFSGADFLGFEWQWGGPFDAAFGSETLTTPTHFVFQAAFAAAAVTIVSGAVAERASFKAYFFYSLFLASVVYPLVASWTFGGGWLSDMDTPFVDFAGGTVVHVTGGVAAFVGAAVLGPRIGRYAEDGSPRAIPAHSLPMMILGVFILMVGWFGFNTGSVLGANASVGAIAMVTATGAAAGGVAALINTWMTLKTPDISMIGNGVLAGLVSITAGAFNFSFFGAAIVGAIGGVIVVQAVVWLDRVKVDDPVGAAAVHGAGGIWGTIAVGLFADPDAVAGGIGGEGPAGLLYGGGTDQLISQIIGVGAVSIFVLITSFAFFLVLRETGIFRVDAETEIDGLDIVEHATPAYGDDYQPGGGVGDSYDELLDDDLLDELLS